MMDNLRHLMLPLALLLPLLAGCGSDLPSTHAVRGRVTFNGGPPPAPGYINFQPIETAEGYPARPGSAAFGADGYFEAGAYEDGAGLVPGRYRVAIECWKEKPNEAAGTAGTSYVPANLTLPELEVPGESEAVYDVPLTQGA